jgi:diadenosine tetraphosphate (Ap4A) HIT family hydrolase
MHQRHQIDTQEYVRRITHGTCFICEFLAGNPQYHHHMVYENETVAVFLNKYPTVYGYVLVVPRQHCEQVSGDFTLDEYLALQRVVYCVAEAVRLEVKAERVYILSLGSQQGNRHVHWHVAPLPTGVPFEQQQFAALTLDNGVIEITEEEMEQLAKCLGERVAQTMLFG